MKSMSERRRQLIVLAGICLLPLPTISRPAVADDATPATGLARENPAEPTQTGTAVRCELSSTSGKPLTLRWVVAPGSRVKKGDLLFRIDSAELEREISALKTQRLMRKSEVVSVQAEYRRAEIKLEAAVESSRAALRTAEIALSAFEGGERQLKSRELAIGVLIAETELIQAQRRSASGDADETVVRIAKANLDVAKLRQQVFEKFTVPKQLELLKSQVAAAKRAATIARIDGEAAIESMEAALAARKELLEVESRRLDRLIQQLRHCEVKAPHPGVVAAARHVRLNAGVHVRQGQIVLYLKRDAEE